MKKKISKQPVKNPKKPRARNSLNSDLVSMHTNQEQMKDGVDPATISEIRPKAK